MINLSSPSFGDVEFLSNQLEHPEAGEGVANRNWTYLERPNERFGSWQFQGLPLVTGAVLVSLMARRFIGFRRASTPQALASANSMQPAELPQIPATKNWFPPWQWKDYQAQKRKMCEYMHLWGLHDQI